MHATVTGALRNAQLSTVARVKALEAEVRGQLKDIGKLRRNIAETKKHEAEMIEVRLGRRPGGWQGGWLGGRRAAVGLLLAGVRCKTRLERRLCGCRGPPAPLATVQAVAKDLQRKVAKRDARQMVLPVERFINTRWGDHFTGLGTGKTAGRQACCMVPASTAVAVATD